MKRSRWESVKLFSSLCFVFPCIIPSSRDVSSRPPVVCGTNAQLPLISSAGFPFPLSTKCRLQKRETRERISTNSRGLAYNSSLCGIKKYLLAFVFCFYVDPSVFGGFIDTPPLFDHRKHTLMYITLCVLIRLSKFIEIAIDHFRCNINLYRYFVLNKRKKTESSQVNCMER